MPPTTASSSRGGGQLWHRRRSLGGDIDVSSPPSLPVMLIPLPLSSSKAQEAQGAASHKDSEQSLTTKGVSKMGRRADIKAPPPRAVRWLPPPSPPAMVSSTMPWPTRKVANATPNPSLGLGSPPTSVMAFFDEGDAKRGPVAAAAKTGYDRRLDGSHFSATGTHASIQSTFSTTGPATGATAAAEIEGSTTTTAGTGGPFDSEAHFSSCSLHELFCTLLQRFSDARAPFKQVVDDVKKTPRGGGGGALLNNGQRRRILGPWLSILLVLALIRIHSQHRIQSHQLMSGEHAASRSPQSAQKVARRRRRRRATAGSSTTAKQHQWRRTKPQDGSGKEGDAADTVFSHPPVTSIVAPLAATTDVADELARLHRELLLWENIEQARADLDAARADLANGRGGIPAVTTEGRRAAVLLWETVEQARADLANAKGEIAALTAEGRRAAAAVAARVKAKGAEAKSRGTSDDDAVEVNKRSEVETVEKVEAVDKSVAAARVKAATNGAEEEAMGATTIETKQQLLDDTKIAPIFCTKEASYRPRPDDLEVEQHNKIMMAQDVIAYIVAKLHEVDVPVTLMFGNLLHEHRNGTGPCVQTALHDNDFDIGVFARHFPLVVAMTGDIQKKFGWKVKFIVEKRSFLVFMPPGAPKQRPGYQIDVYGFERKDSSSILFPWPRNLIDIATFLPLVKHKMPAYNRTTAASVDASDEEQPYFHVPYNVPCVLANLYGPDFMTNATKQQYSPFSQAHWYHGSECAPTTLCPSQQHDLERQLDFL